MSLVKKITVLTFGKGLNILVNLLFLPYMARVLSYEDYGSYGQVILIAAFIGAFLSFGLSQIIYVYLSKENNPKEVLFSNLFTLLVMGALGSILMFVLSSYTASWFNNPQLSFLVKVFSISLLFQLPFQSIISYLIFIGKVKRTVSITVSTNVLKVVLVIASIQLYNSVALALTAIVITYVFQLLFAYLSIKTALIFSIDYKKCLNQLKDGFPLGLTALFGSGILYLDGLMVSKMEGVQAYAIYRNGAIEVPFIATLYASIAAIILPEVSKLYHKGALSQIVALKKKVIMNTMALIYPILIFLLFNSQDLIVLYLGDKYESSAIIFLLFNLTLLVRINNYADILIAANLGRLILRYYSIAFLINALLNYFLILEFGIIGAAISTVVSLMLLAGLQLFKTLQLLHSSFFEIIHFIKSVEIILVSLASVLLLEFVFQSMTNTTFELILKFTLFCSFIYMYLLKRNLIERNIFLQLLPLRIRKRIK
tara:strand:+ start:609 stop:2057 length:1449 start_codon:yes stop_codon:yes gene_type:complete